ncbi:hypothetical protein [Rugamonas rubra]|uniref:Uncharacterized protein n=1 Tax=Rugamonas rubra TaxID=758825 RepID=A0A1I4HM02_9BURK|nr:hypothetical protein [Rugamonas rubra]SFL42737.1 hypothetical protein SAMN02982985_00069 [Rugamonas rubra]
MDQLKLRSLVFEKTGVRIDVDDPIFALVALNEAVLAEAVERHIALLDAASRELLAQSRTAAGLAPAAAGAPAATAPDVAAAASAGPAAIVPPLLSRPIATRPGAFQPGELRLLAAAAGVAVLSAVLALAGQALLFQPAPAPQAPALTAAQAGALRDGERLARAVARLDAKTRAQLQAELQKP